MNANRNAVLDAVILAETNYDGNEYKKVRVMKQLMLEVDTHYAATLSGSSSSTYVFPFEFSNECKNRWSSTPYGVMLTNCYVHGKDAMNDKFTYVRNFDCVPHDRKRWIRYGKFVFRWQECIRKVGV